MKSRLKNGKWLVLAVSVLLAFTLGACSGADSGSTEKETTENETEGNGAEMITEHKEKAAALNGKRVIFIGNSYMYYGQMVRNRTFAAQTVEMRSHDDGNFYALCKELGAEVNVVNWTFGSHQLSDFFSDSCHAGKTCEGENHLAALEGQAFDYVVFQVCGREEKYDYLPYLDKALEFFKNTNPDTKFLYLYNPAAYGINGFDNGTVMKTTLENLETVKEKGITVVDWGKVVMDLMYGKVRVRDSKFLYNQESFIIAQNEKDGYHPNQLAGLITTAMTYMAMTGDKAEGLPYDYVGNTSLNPENSIQKFKETKYKLRTSNYDEILGCESEIRGIFEIIDEYTGK